MKTFAQDRPDYLRTHVSDYFDCGSNGRITVNITEGGAVRLNTLTLRSADTRSGVCILPGIRFI
jgi:hypothetical protein